MSNAYKDIYKPYFAKNIPLLPDKFASKMPILKGWNGFCRQLPTESDCEQWAEEFTNVNFSIPLGPASGLCVLDVDTDDEEIIKLVKEHMPPSPVIRYGSKGYAAFYRWNHLIKTDTLKDGNGNMIVELLADNKKITIPPSIHPSGLKYRWEDKSILDVDIDDLPPMPIGALPALSGILGSRLARGDEFTVKTNAASMKVSSGRTDALVKEAGRLIGEMERGQTTIDGAVNSLLEFDEENHQPPKFTDVKGREVSHNHGLTNAYRFFVDVLNTVQSRRFESKQQFASIIGDASINREYAEAVVKKKFQNQENQKVSENLELPTLPPLMNRVYNYILSQSWVEQPNLAFSATLALFSTLVNRKLVFKDSSPNLFVLNIAPSGSGKDAPQQIVKNILRRVKTGLLGAGDYVSDASLMDSFDLQKARLDVIDEASGMLGAINRSKNGYDAKMADILCELYTTSNGYFLGRQVAEGRKGECERPFVTLLMSTTPRGFESSVSIKSIEKGLLGRCLLFKGDGQKAGRIPELAPIPVDLLEELEYIANYKPEQNHFIDENISCDYDIVETDSEEADSALRQIHAQFEAMRIQADPNELTLPIIARCFQQTNKIALICAASRCMYGIPKVSKEDLEIGFKVALYNLAEFRGDLDANIHSSKDEAIEKKIINYVKAQNKQGIFPDKRKMQGSRIIHASTKKYLDSLVDSGILGIRMVGSKKTYVYQGEEG